MRLTVSTILTCMLMSLAWPYTANAQQAQPRGVLSETAAFFAKRPFVHNISISPDGRKLMVAAESGGDQTITFLDADSMEALHIVEFDNRWRLGSTAWVSNDSLVVSPFYQPMRRNFSVPSGNLSLIHANGKQPKVLVGPLAGVNRTGALAGRPENRVGAILLDPLREKKDRILVQTFDGNGTGFAELQLQSGRLRNKTRGPSRFCQFAVDNDGQVRFCSVQDLKTDLATIYQLSEAGWKEIYVSKKAARARVLSGAGDDGLPLVLADAGAAGTSSLFLLSSYLQGGEPLFTDPVWDFWNIKISRHGGVWGISNPNPEPSYIYPENGNPTGRTLAGVHKSLVNAFPSHFVDFTSVDTDYEKLIARVASDTSPGVFYLYDRKKNELRQLAERMPWLAGRPLAKKAPFTVQTEDGLTLHGILTRALTDAPQRSPSIVLVHGGPHGPFDTFHYEREIQFLAAIGLNVVQVNFRGSGGFGTVFVESGYRQWSRLMVDDVIAGFQKLAGKEIGEDACIYGASYGAFNALSAAFRAPDTFVCAAGHVGVYSLPEMFRGGDIPETEEGLAYLNRVLGEDVSVHRADSPAFNAGKIKVPVFLSAGSDDVRAPERQTKIMAAALKAAGNPPREMYIDREGHGFASAENEAERLVALGGFFADHLSTTAR